MNEQMIFNIICMVVMAAILIINVITLNKVFKKGMPQPLDLSHQEATNSAQSARLLEVVQGNIWVKVQGGCDHVATITDFSAYDSLGIVGVLVKTTEKVSEEEAEQWFQWDSPFIELWEIGGVEMWLLV